MKKKTRIKKHGNFEPWIDIKMTDILGKNSCSFISDMMVGSWSLLWCIVIYLSKATCTPDIVLEIDEDFRRPIWNVAHMVNSLHQVDYYLDRGANSLEFDVAYDWEGKATYTYHGIPCDCFRSCNNFEDIVTYLEYLQKITTPGTKEYRPQLVLLFMDMKVQGLTPTSKIRAGEDIAMKLLNHYWKKGAGGNAFVLLSVPSIMHMDFVNSFRHKLKVENFTLYQTKIGFEFSGNEDLDSIRHAFEREQIKDHIWQGDGITNCLPRGTGRLRDAIRRRDQPGQTYVDKVYWWTVDKMATMRTTLNMGVDGMITNYPDRLVSVLKEEGYSGKFRLATLEDSPWKKYAPRLASLITLPQEARGSNITDELEEEELLYNCGE